MSVAAAVLAASLATGSQKAIVSPPPLKPVIQLIARDDSLGAIAANLRAALLHREHLAHVKHVKHEDHLLAEAENPSALPMPPWGSASASAGGYVPQNPVSGPSGGIPRNPQPYPAPRNGSFDPSGQLTPSEVGELWIEAGGPAWAETESEGIAMCESTDNTKAYNPSGATGLFQILGGVIPGNLYDAYVNALNAVAKFEAAGDTWSPWVCQP